MEFDFRDAFSRIGINVVEATNKRIQELKENSGGTEHEISNLIINEMINDNIRITLYVLEEYHQALMKYLSKEEAN